MHVLMLAFVPLVAAIVAAAVSLLHPALARRLPWVKGGSPVVRGAVAATLVLVAPRLASLWFLHYLKQTNQETLAALPLVLLLYPEALLLEALTPMSSW